MCVYIAWRIIRGASGKYGIIWVMMKKLEYPVGLVIWGISFRPISAHRLTTAAIIYFITLNVYFLNANKEIYDIGRSAFVVIVVIACVLILASLTVSYSVWSMEKKQNELLKKLHRYVALVL